MSIFTLRNLPVALALCAAFSAAPLQRAQAAPTASGHAYDVSIHLSIGGIPFDVNAADDVQFANQATAWSGGQQTAALNVNVGFASLAAQDLDVEAQWQPGGGFLVAGTQATLNNVSLATFDLLSRALLALGATQIQATSLIAGTCPASARPALEKSLVQVVNDYIYVDGFEQRTLNPSSGVNTPGLGVAMQGTSLLGLPASPGANTTLPLPAGTGVLVLDEQNVTGDGITGLAVSNNGVHVTLNALGLITGDVILAHADAAIACN